VDWVLVDVAATNGRLSTSKSALLLSDGWVRSPDGAAGVTVEASPGSYLLTVRHRNHAGASSALPVVFTNNWLQYDFSGSPAQYLGGTNACVELEPGVWGMIAGDADGDGRITPTDRAIVTQQMGKTGYLSGDLNLDGKVDGND
jgi:hypothetical protein